MLLESGICEISFLWNPESWSLKSRIQLKRIRNPDDVPLARNPGLGIQNPQFETRNPILFWIPRYKRRRELERSYIQERMGTSLQFPEVSRCAVCSLVASVEEARMKLSFPNYFLGQQETTDSQEGAQQQHLITSYRVIPVLQARIFHLFWPTDGSRADLSNGCGCGCGCGCA